MQKQPTKAIYHCGSTSGRVFSCALIGKLPAATIPEAAGQWVTAVAAQGSWRRCGAIAGLAVGVALLLRRGASRFPARAGRPLAPWRDDDRQAPPTRVDPIGITAAPSTSGFPRTCGDRPACSAASPLERMLPVRNHASVRNASIRPCYRLLSRHFLLAFPSSASKNTVTRSARCSPLLVTPLPFITKGNEKGRW